VAAKEKSTPEEVAPKAAGTEAVKNDSSSKPKAVAKGGRKAPLSQPNKDNKAMAEAKPNGRKAPARKQVKGKGKKKKGNKQQGRKQTVRTKPTTTERADLPAKSDPKVKGKKKQQTTTNAPVYEDEEPEEVQYSDGKDDGEIEDYDIMEEPDRRSQKPRKRFRRPPPKVIFIVREPPPAPPRPNFPTLPTPERPNFPTRPSTHRYPTYETSLNPYYSSGERFWTTYYPKYDWTKFYGNSETSENSYYKYSTYMNGNNNQGETEYTSTPNYQTSYDSYNPYYSTGDDGLYQQFLTTYYPKYDWTKFYGNSGTPDKSYYYTSMPPSYNEASTELNETQYNYNLAYGSTAKLPEYFPNYNWSLIYGSSGMPFNGVNWSSAPVQNSTQPSIFKNLTDTTTESSTMDSMHRLRAAFGVTLKNQAK
jgi:hypothetical protein